MPSDEIFMPEQNEIADRIYVSRNVFTAEECRKFIELSEREGYDAATINGSGGAVRRPDVHNNARVILDEELFA